MKKPTIRAIFVDFGNVCATYDFSRFIERLSRATGVPEKEIRDVLFRNPNASDGNWGYGPLFAALECGEIEPIGFFSVLSRMLRCAREIDFKTFAHLWADIFDEENKGLDRLLAKLPQQKYLLSNINKIVYERHISKCAIVRNHFPRREQHILSCDVGAVKPNPMIYKVALHRAKAVSEESLFIDDMPENIEAWRALGGHGIVYHAGKDSIGKLKKELRALGVLK
ncbi:MAG: HAD family phosphatase [bacterium]|nr:HAD family phosphatase [bacterium]